MNIFEKASRARVRFDTPRGQFSVEQLWSLPLISDVGDRLSLDSVAKSISRAMREIDEESFVGVKSKESDLLELKLDLVKHVIEVRKKEVEEQEMALVNAQKRKKIDKILAAKEDEGLKGLSVEELMKLREEL